MKFNKTWLKDESIRNLILTNWVPYNPASRLTVPLQFVDNFSRLKGLIKKWAGEKRRREDLELRQIEKDIFNIMDLEGGGYMNQDSKDTLVRLQSRRNTILLDLEET